MSNGTLAPPEFDETGYGAPSPASSPGGKRRGLGSRLSIGHVLTAVAGILTFFFLLLVLSERNEPEVTVVVASDPVEEGVPLTADLFDEVSLPEDNPLADGAVTSLAEVDGTRTAQRDIPDGAILTEQDFVDVAAETPGGGLRSLSIPIEADQAVGGEIRDSDLVDIIAVDKGEAWIPAAGLEVLDSGNDGSGALIAGDSGNEQGYITMAVTADEAVAISYASGNASEIFVIRSTGAPALPELGASADPNDIGVGSPAGGTSFEPSNVDESLNEALGEVLTEMLGDADG